MMMIVISPVLLSGTVMEQHGNNSIQVEDADAAAAEVVVRVQVSTMTTTVADVRHL